MNALIRVPAVRILCLMTIMLLWPGAGSFTRAGNPGAAIAQDEIPADASRILLEIEKGIQQSRSDEIVNGISRQIYLDLPGREGGYYSANQARYILQEFFRQRKVVHFRFGTKGSSEGVPFATGGGTSVVRGVRGAFQVYVSLARHDDGWVISQFSIY